MKRGIALILALLCAVALVACGNESGGKMYEKIPFEEGQLYAVAYLGYEEMTDGAYFVDTYLKGEKPPVHYVSGGEYYLIIPRYEGMKLELSRNSILSIGETLFYEETDFRPFIVQCNISDIFPDVNIRITYNSESVDFSPYISLKDGSVVVGERGLELVKEAEE